MCVCVYTSVLYILMFMFLYVCLYTFIYMLNIIHLCMFQPSSLWASRESVTSHNFLLPQQATTLKV